MKAITLIALIFFHIYTSHAMQDEIKKENHEHVFGLITEMYEEHTIYPELANSDSAKIHNPIYRESTIFKELKEKYDLQNKNNKK